MSIPTIIALGAVAGFFLFIVGVMVYRRSLGTLAITTADEAHQPGDDIDAHLTLTATRKLDWNRITVALRCLDTADRGGSQPWHEVYRNEQVLAGPGSLQPGGSQVFAVRFVVPSEITSPGLSFDMPESIEAPLRKLGEFMGTDVDVLMRHRKMDFRWEMVAEVERDNVSMVDSHRLDIDLVP